MTQHVSNLAIEELASGAADAVAREHLETCARCREDLATAQAARAEFGRVVYPRTVGKLRPARRRWWIAPMMAVAAAAVAIALWISRRDLPSRDDVAIKGELTFRVFAKRGDAVFVVEDAARLVAGDRIRFVAGSRGPAFLLVASIDGAGQATIYYPYGADHSGAVGVDASDLPGSIVLDDAPGPERVFALFSDQPLAAVPVARALRELGARGPDAIRETRTLDVPCAQISISFDKVTP